MRIIFVIIIFLCFKISNGQTQEFPSGSRGYFVSKALELSRDKQYDQALIFTDSAMVIDSTGDGIFAIRAEILWMKKDFSTAAASYQKAMLLDDDSSYLFGSHLFLGVLYEKANMLPQAQKQYLKAVHLFQNYKHKTGKTFDFDNKSDYALSLFLSGNISAWDSLIKEEPFSKYLKKYIGKSREEVLKIYFEPFSG